MRITVDNYTIEYSFKDEDMFCGMDFLIKEIVGWGANKETGEWSEPLYGLNTYSDDFEHGDEVCHGFIKWDGCSHWYFTEYQHLCGRKSGEAFGRLIGKIFDLAEENLKGYDKEIGS